MNILVISNIGLHLSLFQYTSCRWFQLLLDCEVYSLPHQMDQKTCGWASNMLRPHLFDFLMSIYEVKVILCIKKRYTTQLKLSAKKNINLRTTPPPTLPSGCQWCSQFWWLHQCQWSNPSTNSVVARRSCRFFSSAALFVPLLEDETWDKSGEIAHVPLYVSACSVAGAWLKSEIRCFAIAKNGFLIFWCPNKEHLERSFLDGRDIDMLERQNICQREI